MKRLFFALAATLIIQLSGMFTGIVSARLLGPENRGLLALLISFSAFLYAAGSLSLQDALVFRVARSDNPQEKRQWLASALVLGGGTAAVTTSIAWVLLPIVLSSPDEHLRLAILLALFIIPAAQLSNIFVAYFQTAGSAEFWTFLRICPPLIGAGLTAVYLFTGLGRSVEWYVILPLAASTVVLACCTLQFWRMNSALPLPEGDKMRRLLSFGLRVHPSVAGTLREEADRLIISFFLPMAALGQYAVAATLPTLILAAAITADMVLFPRLASVENVAEAKALFLRSLRAGLIILIFAAALVAAASVLLIPFLFGAAYRPASFIAPIMSATLFLVSLRYIIGSGFKALGQPFLHARGDITALAASVVLIPAGVAVSGITGAASGAFLAQLVALAVAAVGIRKLMGVAPLQLLRFGRADYVYLLERIKSVRALKDRD